MIDVHCHYFGEELLEAIDDVLVSEVGPEASIEQFYESDDLGLSTEGADARVEKMDEWGLDASVLSFPAPDAFIDEEYLSRPSVFTRVSETINDHLAEASERHPDRLYGFASIPLVAPEAAADELDRAMDDLGLQGVALDSNVFGKPLSDPEFRPFFERADQRGATIFVHPNNPAGADRMDDYYGESMIGFPFDTTLMASKLIFSGFMDRYPNLDVVLSHLGGALPYLQRRLEFLHDPDDPEFDDLEKHPPEYLGDFWYDTAMTYPEAMELALGQVGDRLLFGSDYPFGPENAVATTDEQVRSLDVGEDRREKIFERNATALLDGMP